MPASVPFLVSRVLGEAGFVHAFSTRRSVAGDLDFDFALNRDDARLRDNLGRLGASVGFDPARLFQTRQVHGSGVVIARGARSKGLGVEADALVAEPGSRDAVAVRVADCVPVLVADPESGRVAAIHAGWRGIVAGVVGAALRSFGEGRRLVAAIGPCIGPCCFEVSTEVAARIAHATTAEAQVRHDRAREGKAYIDLRRAVRAQLVALGLDDAAIDDVPSASREGCTRCEADVFHSFRRDGEASGRLVGVIVAR